MWFCFLCTSEVNPLGPFTPEAAKAISIATDAIQRSQVLRQEVEAVIAETDKIKKDIHQSVNHGFTKKISESNTMKVSW